MASQDKEKKKGGLREALFGGTGSNGSAYRIIYLAITMVMTDKGPEQYAILLYGDDQGVVYSNTLPAHTIMYNYNDDVDGILVQMPLPKHIDEAKVKETINPVKDVDGFHPLSKCIPCTPKGIIDYLKNENVEFTGKNAVVIGRSNIVGKPVAHLLLGLNCNVTVLHSRTSKEDMNFYLAHADIVVVAVGKKYFLSDQPLKDTAVVVDVGINRVDGKLYGDCAPNLKVRLQTPVPGGIGLLTRVSMLENLLICYNNRRGN